MKILRNGLISIKNAVAVSKFKVIIQNSKLTQEVLRIMQKHEYIENFNLIEDGRGNKLEIIISKNLNSCNAISPRFPVTVKDFEKYERRYLPGMGFGILIVTTSKGVLTSYDAKELGVGGKLLAWAY